MATTCRAFAAWPALPSTPRRASAHALTAHPPPQDARRKSLAEELEGFSVTLTPGELLWAVLSLLDKTLTILMQVRGGCV